VNDFDQPHDDALDQDGVRRQRERNKKKRQRAAVTAERRQAVRAADAERKRHAWASLSEEVRAAKRKKDAERKRRSWESLSEEEKATKRNKDAARNREKRQRLRFIGVDCEGAGKNAGGQQNLVLLNAEGEGFTSSLHKGIGGCGHIESAEAFEWILSLPGKDEAILVSYFFNWDATQILHNIGTEAAKDLFDPNNYGPGGTRRWTHFNSRYAVKYIPKRFLAVARRGGPQNRALLATARYIYDEFGVFQTKVVNAGEKMHRRTGVKMHHGRAASWSAAFQFD
jgi:hypothetical protein